MATNTPTKMKSYFLKQRHIERDRNSEEQKALDLFAALSERAQQEISILCFILKNNFHEEVRMTKDSDYPYGIGDMGSLMVICALVKINAL